MTSSPTITLFTQGAPPRRQPVSLLASLVVHAAALFVLSFGLLYVPRIDTRIATERYTVRHIDLRLLDRPISRAAYHLPVPAPRAQNVAAAPPSLRLAAHARPAPQTLLQPDLPSHLVLKRPIPVPRVILWSPRRALVKDIVAPNPEAPAAADVDPALDPPNRELNLADVALSSAPLPSVKQQLLPATTSPVAIPDSRLLQMPPDTVAQTAAQPTPTALLSLSDLRMADGTATLPPVNESATSTSAGTLAPQPPQDPASTGPSSPAAAAANADAVGSGSPLSATRITLPKNGQFGAVVVGNSIEDAFPEMAGVWNGRMAYTVYLHVGLQRSWILQYSLPSSAASAGPLAHLDAPWPYNIVRPDLAPGAIDADALLVRGFVNQSGRFEDLDIVFPSTLPQAQFVLDCLNRWQFRPATVNGQLARVEVLLVIPEAMDY